MGLVIGPFDTPKQSRNVIKTLDSSQSYQIRYKNNNMPLKLVSADQNASLDIQTLKEPTIVGVISNICEDSTSYLLYVKKWKSTQ
ncbi:hypothetical protein BmR1_04g08895 [Babesia microti strain RI]|uniref:Uncharacterized protein n=1 Tax=Babesia microti (strain RI) TaxID=1133968 RepID=I7ISY2_BABMR|nr:hypothetical protein BmR1_04g08895 [Babesia microti strain RI]CCF75956.1 hypothetical protein BmR1_04g08895 [Babesia microti strain RI]|eukprot:XP_012650364.1 hypothetical protein BmR1_04g08895 [Babesia microti strain RI]